AGEALLVHADAIAQRLELASRQLAELKADTRLRIGAFSSALAGLLPPMMERLDAEVQIEEGDSVALAARVSSGALHMSIGFQDAARPRREHEGLERRDLLRETFLLARSPEHPLARRTQLQIGELRDEPWVAPSADGLVARTCEQAGFTPRLIALTRDPIAIREFVARGTAVTLVP